MSQFTVWSRNFPLNHTYSVYHANSLLKTRYLASASKIWEITSLHPTYKTHSLDPHSHLKHKRENYPQKALYSGRQAAGPSHAHARLRVKSQQEELQKLELMRITVTFPYRTPCQILLQRVRQGRKCCHSTKQCTFLGCWLPVQQGETLVLQDTKQSCHTKMS